MRNSLYRTITAAGLAGLLALASACGSSSGTATESPSDQSSSQPADSGSDSGSSDAGSSDDAAAGVTGTNTAPDEDLAKAVIDAIVSDPSLTSSLPDKIQSDGVTVATSEGYPPMEMFAKDGKTIIGIDPAVAMAIANRLGVKLNLVNVEDFNAQIPGVISGRYDMIMSSMTDTKERQGKVTFVDYVSDGQGFIVKAGNPEGINTPADLCGKTLAVVDNGSALDLGNQFDADCKSAGSDAINILTFPGDSDALLQVQNGRAAADINDFPVAAYRAQTSDGELEAVQIPGNEAPLGIGMNPSATELINGVQAALDSLIKDGTYQKVLEAWDVAGMAVDSAVINGGS